ncbi:MAG: hypothetical protein ACRD41_09815, partial [Candidatus Acidiferrales bacterium]
LEEVSAKKVNREATLEDKQAFIGALRTYATERGKSDGWVAHKYRSKFGVWPNDGRVHNAPASILTTEVRNWIQHENIKYIKGREKMAAANA